MKLRIRGLEFSYGSVAALKDVTLEIGESELVAIVGPNGAGKSTLLKCINRVLKPQKGVIFVDGREIRNLSQKEVAKLFGYVPQSLRQTFPAKVFEVVLTGRKPHTVWGSKKDLEIAIETLRLLKMEDLAMREFNELSGGQQQKVLIARALAQEPKVLLLDEPTANLDIRHQLEVMEIVKNLVKNKALTALIAIHDLNLASKYADRIVMMKDGRIFAAGRAEEVLKPVNIEVVYNVRARVLEVDGRLYVIPDLN